ncbi:MAG: tetratricopeptide repeat protein [Bacteroidetes bacterium]|nr:tetratricopeptide repeat protein [Bacteroidota bacterium]
MASKPLKNKQSKTTTLSLENSRLDKSIIIFLSAIAFLLYFNTLNHGYTLDDYSVIKENIVTVQGFKGIPTILKTSYRYGYLSINDGLYRPLSLVTYAIEWGLFPDKPAISHWINVFLYILTAIVLYRLLRRLLIHQNVLIPLLTTLLFIVHPIHTEIVASIKSRDEILSFLFCLLAGNALLSYSEKKSTSNFLLVSVYFFLALLSKETGITMLAILPLLLYFFRNTTVKQTAISAIPLAVPVVLYFFIRSAVLGSAKGLESVSYIDNSLFATKDTIVQLATAFSVLYEYIQLLFVPTHLVCDRSFNEIPNVPFSNIRAIAGLVIHLALAAIAFVGLKKRTPLSFAILFYLTSIALFSNIVVKIGSIMAERFVYFASFGFCLAVVLLLIQLLKVDTTTKIDSPKKLLAVNKPLIGLLGLVFFLFSFKTIDRNSVWKSNFTLYSNDVNLSPNSCRIHYYLGRELIKEIAPNEKDPRKQKDFFMWGIKEMEKSIAIAPRYADAYSQMGLGYKRMGNSEKAIECYKKGLEIQPNDPITLNNLAAEYFSKGMYKECIEIFERILVIDPRYVDAMVNLASCYGTVQNFDKAIYWFERAVQLSPTNARAFYFLGMTYGYKGNKVKETENLQKAYQLDASLKPK